MRPHALLVVVAGLLVAADAKDDTPKEVEKLTRTLNEAFVKQDADTIKRMITDDHTTILGNGVRLTRAEQLKSLADLKLATYTMEEAKVTQPLKDVAVLTYKGMQKGSYKGKDFSRTIAVTSVWVRQDGKWLEAAYQETPIEK
ncbi:MAG: nuclear transport factor 2 family protein [Gemmataceae bacterium]|nr:nuclear transport factor 2 family protein [Gemmataceae bacterium]